MPTRSREIRLVARPCGVPVATDFELAEVVDGRDLTRNEAREVMAGIMYGSTET